MILWYFYSRTVSVKHIAAQVSTVKLHVWHEGTGFWARHVSTKALYSHAWRVW